MISKYNAMWLFVAFDLPTLTKKDRRVASRFRNDLKDNGFTKTQKSVYTYYAFTKEKADTISIKIKNIMPNCGDIMIVYITDKQFGMIKHYHKRVKEILKQPDLFDCLT